MNIYMDNRLNDYKINAYVYTDDIYYGKVGLRKNEITGFEVPKDIRKLRISFSSIFDSAEELSCIEMTEEMKTNLPLVERAKGGTDKQAWQYPYDTEIDVSVYSDDLILYETSFQEKEVKGGKYYHPKRITNGKSIESRLIRRREHFGMEEYRKKGLLIYSTVAVIAAVFFAYYIFFYINKYLPNQEFYAELNPRRMPLLDVIFSGGASIYCTLRFTDLFRYIGLYREDEMKDEYILEDEATE